MQKLSNDSAKSMKLPEGILFYGVTTTGVFCRPSCPARKPLAKNVRFYRAVADAIADGMRPCLRCRPDEIESANAARIRAACAYIDAHSDERLSLEALSRQAAMSRFHFQRMFKAVAGITPKRYQEAARLKALKAALKSSNDVTSAVYDAGFSSPSRVYANAGAALGMTPKQYRAHGEGVAITHATAETALGLLMIGATDRGLCFVQFGESAEELLQRLRAEYPRAQIQAMTAPSEEFIRWVVALRDHVAGIRIDLSLPVDVRATAFQMRVWMYLQKIPYAQVQSYSEVAAGIGRPGAARAVAKACAGNPVALVIPCHRVIRGTGELGGYRWGLARKRVLIDTERKISSTPV